MAKVLVLLAFLQLMCGGAHRMQVDADIVNSGAGSDPHSGRRLGDKEYRQEEMENRMKYEEWDRQQQINFENGQFEEQQNPQINPPQGKPFMSQNGQDVNWFPPTSGWTDEMYFLVQLRVCEKSAWFFCGQWWDMYKTKELSCDISQFELDPKEHEVRIKSCIDEESVEECKEAWFRKWSLISEKFQPASPTVKGPSADELQAAADRKQAMEERQQSRKRAQAVRQDLVESDARERQQQMRADMKARENQEARLKWQEQRETEREQEKTRTQEAGAQLAAKLASGWMEEKTLDSLVRVKYMAEEQRVSREGNLVLVQTYIAGGRKIIEEARTARAEPSWMPRFKGSLSSKFQNYPVESSIRILRNAFEVAIDAERAESNVRIREQRQNELRAKVEEARMRRNSEPKSPPAKAVSSIPVRQQQPRHYQAAASPPPEKQSCAALVTHSVKLADGYENEYDAEGGPLQPGGVGRVKEDSDGACNSHKPCLVLVEHGPGKGQKWCYSLDALKQRRHKHRKHMKH